MSAKSRLRNEVVQNLKSKTAFGQSKHEAKKAAKAAEAQMKIFSFKTYHTYREQCERFTAWAYDNYHCKTLSECEAHVGDYVSHLRESGTSAWTQKVVRSAVGKLYGHSFPEAKTDDRSRSTAWRSREVADRDYHFSEKKNADLIEFCRCTGLRRAELQSLTGRQTFERNGQVYVHVDAGTKGGRERDVPILGNNAKVIERIESTPAGERVWGQVHSACDVHSYRAEYAQALYDKLARIEREIPPEDRYHCRGDRKGDMLDKRAMKEVSEALGHSRINVIAQSYLGHAS